MSYLFKYAGSWGGKKLQQIKRNKYLNKQICWIDIPRQFRALSQKKAFFQDTKGHNSVINRWCTMPFGVHHPLIHIYTHSKFQWNPPRHFHDMALDTKVPDGRTDGRTDIRTDGQRQNNIPSPLSGDNNCQFTRSTIVCFL